MLEDRLSTYENPRNKIGRMVSADELVPVRRGLYETNRTIPGYLLAPCLYGPSYLSFEYALDRHGLIPEAVRSYTSAVMCLAERYHSRSVSHLASYLEGARR